ncbi:hypothetical protein [Pseudacidobacterium ailaaui]|jgi:hypothetical protein|uniref:hypothetical protein n=1 Tax=Pseudacidobacterium ailaaui TaxID=1382359 RepID=UPI00047ECF17|nr:hypothetical protein [Pseudacidobacterium ailaaui]
MATSDLPMMDTACFGGYCSEVIHQPTDYSSVEVHGVSFLSEMDVAVNDDTPEFFSVYVRHMDGTAVCVGDFAFSAEADEYAIQIAGRYHWTVTRLSSALPR